MWFLPCKNGRITFPDQDYTCKQIYLQSVAFLLQEYWRYSYPLHENNTVPSWTVPMIATVGPLLVIAVLSLVFRPTRAELHSVIMGLLSSVFITATLTNIIKIGVSALAHLTTCLAKSWQHVAWAALCILECRKELKLWNVWSEADVALGSRTEWHHSTWWGNMVIQYGGNR